MPTTLEYPWNGVVVTGPLPIGTTGGFVDDPTRGIERMRVMLDPRVVMPLAAATGTLPNLTAATIYGSPPNANQSAHAREIVQICYDRTGLGVDARRQRAAIMSLACALVESGIQIYANSAIPQSLALPHEQVGSNGYSVGIFQQQVGPGFQINSFDRAGEAMEVNNSTQLWLDRLSAQANWWVVGTNAVAGDIIQAAQQSGAGADVLYENAMVPATALFNEIQWPPQQPPAASGTTIPATVQTALLEIANGAQAVSNFTANVKIEWCLDATQWPTSATAGRRPRVADLTTFWGAMNTLLGAHASTWGFSLLNNPTFAETAAANADTDPAVATWANVTWSGGTNPTSADHQQACRWLEAMTAKVVTVLRTAGFAKNIVVPTMYAPGHLKDIALFHPNGPWINDANVWFETSFYPAGLDETQIKSSYATYNTFAAGLSTTYRASWQESAYYTAGSGNSVIDPEALPAPPQEALPADPNAAPETVPAAPVISSVIVGPASLRVLWTAPSNTGGLEITGYNVTLDDGSGTPTNHPAARDATGLTVDNLSDGVQYAVTVQAINAVGASPASAATLATPLASASPIDVPPPPPPPEPEPPPVRVEQPNLFAFYPEGVGGSQGYFVPTNWAGKNG